MRGFVFSLGIALAIFALFAVPDLAGDSYEWWMGGIPAFLGGSLMTSAVIAK